MDVVFIQKITIEYMKTHQDCEYSYKYRIGDIVFLRTDHEQNERLVTGIKIRQASITYLLSYNTNESEHYDFEISSSINVLKKLN